MIGNKEINNTKDTQLNFGQNHYFENHREQDRRSESKDGFTYITMVGWIDRREKLRRKDDPYYF